ncbi:MAG TPA: hypothetical protein VFC63_25795 [Blastocatellia bacterium]|nr:hypothetical protein [Blastocatellia bacterium]
MKAYDEVIEFIAAGLTPDQLIAFQPSAEVKERIAGLIDREKSESLAADEKSELEHYLQLEYLMRMAKARAHLHSTSELIGNQRP